MSEKSIITRLATATMVGGLLAAATSVQAHLNIARENVFALGEAPREYVEGKSAFINVNLPHSCSNRATGEHFATTDAAILLPNGSSVDWGVTSNHRTGETFSANAVMGTKARVSAVWKKVKVMKGPVDPFYSHGQRSEDTRAIYWLKGKVDNDHYDNLEIKTKFPHIASDSCVTRVKVYIPAVQWCKKGYSIAWIGTADSVWGTGDAKTRVTDRYAPYLYVVRDLENNPLDPGCGDGETVEVRPTVDEINQYLPVEIDD